MAEKMLTRDEAAVLAITEGVRIMHRLANGWRRWECGRFKGQVTADLSVIWHDGWFSLDPCSKCKPKLWPAIARIVVAGRWRCLHCFRLLRDQTAEVVDRPTSDTCPPTSGTEVITVEEFWRREYWALKAGYPEDYIRLQASVQGLPMTHVRIRTGGKDGGR